MMHGQQNIKFAVDDDDDDDDDNNNNNNNNDSYERFYKGYQTMEQQ
jgi:hypothetical protein